MATICQPAARGDFEFERGADNRAAMLWQQDRADGAGYRPVDLTGWSGAFEMYDGSGTLCHSQACLMTDSGLQVAAIPAEAFAGEAWLARASGSWRMVATRGGATVLMGKGYWSLLPEGRPSQAADRRTAGLPSDVELARAAVAAMRDEALAALAAAEAARAGAEASALEAAAHAAEAARRLGGAVRFGAEPPAAPWDGLVWAETDAGGAVVGLHLWDATDLSGALLPEDDLWPEDGLLPEDVGTWRRHSLAVAA